jgi:hypothetical protein
MRVLQDAGEEASEQGTVRWKAIMNEIIRPIYVASFIFLSPMDVREQQVWLTSNTNCADDIALSVFLQGCQEILWYQYQTFMAHETV